MFHLLSLPILSYTTDFRIACLRNQCSRARTDVNLKAFKWFFFFLIRLYFPHSYVLKLLYELLLLESLFFLTSSNAYHSLSNPKQKQLSTSLISYKNTRTTPSITFFPPMTATVLLAVYSLTAKKKKAWHSPEVNTAWRNYAFFFYFLKTNSKHHQKVKDSVTFLWTWSLWYEGIYTELL